jgi:hypothetical protein
MKFSMTGQEKVTLSTGDRMREFDCMPELFWCQSKISMSYNLPCKEALFSVWQVIFLHKTISVGDSDEALFSVWQVIFLHKTISVLRLRWWNFLTSFWYSIMSTNMTIEVMCLAISEAHGIKMVIFPCLIE